MDDLASVESKFLRAHEAGDTEAASVLAAEVRRLRALPNINTPETAAAAGAATVNPNIAAYGRNRRGVTVTPDTRSASEPTRVGGTLQFGPLDTGIPMSEGVTNMLAGAGRSFVERGRGVAQIFGAGPTGQQVDEQKRLDAPLLKTAPGTAGNFLGEITQGVPLAFVPGANTVSGGAAIGGLLGATQPVGTNDTRTSNIALGAGLGAAAPAIANTAASIVSPRVSAQARTLMNEGITPTPGQILGGTAQRVEERLTSLPITGDAIRSSQRHAIDELNKATYARALRPIGGTVPNTVGREAVDDISRQVSNRYDALLPSLTFRADPQFSAELARISNMASQLPPDQAQRFQNILRTQVVGKLTPAGTASGTTIQEINSDLGRISRGYRSDPSFDNRQIGSALNEVQASIRATLARINPAHARELSDINTAYKNYTIIRQASSTPGAVEGIFTPAQLASAVRSADKSVGRGDYARGRAFMQDLSDPARSVLGSAYPDSGTAGRLLMNAGVLGSGMYSPWIPATLGAASIPYVPVARNATAGLLANRPAFAPQAADAIRMGAYGSPFAAQAPVYAGLLGNE